MKTSSLSVTRVGHGQPIILLHGWGMNASVFEPLCVELAKTREVLLVDLPGYGTSEWHNSMLFEDQAALMLANLPEGQLLGWSMGGLYAAEMVRQSPERFSRLILVCCNPCFVRQSDWQCAVDEQVFDTFNQDLQRGWQNTIKRFLSLQMHGSDNARQLIRDSMARLQVGGEPNSEALQFGLDLLKQNDSRELLATLELPIKLILGERDQLVPNGLVKEISKVNPEIQVESLATAAHAPFLSHTAQFLAML
jgi:pimeloyl-[acyl-carrier protein] methyl ester esterase